jgi:UDP-N-acetylmuramoylalanine-D-glutamate ligase
MPGYKKILYSIFFCLTIGLSIVVYWRYYFTFSEGYRTGLIQKLSLRGNFFKTYEGELVLSSIVSSNNIALASEKFYFSVPSDSIATILQNYEGKQVKLHYVQKNNSICWRGDSEYLVDGVTEQSNTK